jgi:hypothetical protein
VLYIVKGAVEIKGNLRYDAKLLADLAAELTTESLAVFFQNSHDSLSLIRREDAHIYLGNG